MTSVSRDVRPEDRVLGQVNDLVSGAWRSALLEGALAADVLADLAAGGLTAADLGARAGADPQLGDGMAAVLTDLGLIVVEQGRLQPTAALTDLLVSGQLGFVRARLTANRLQASQFAQQLSTGALRSGWLPPDGEYVRSQAELSGTGLVGFFERHLLTCSAALDRVLRHGAGPRFLDVGCGAGELSIQMLRAFPRLSAVGVERVGWIAELARERARAAGVEQRFTVLDGDALTVDPGAAFDLVWLPHAFVGPDALRALLSRRRSLLNPDGVVWLFGVVRDPSSERDRLTRMRSAWWGGTVLSGEDVRVLADEHGFSSVQQVPNRSIGEFDHVLLGR
ncbi:class I SAM-dependent methyltransferase [Actinoplanes sp. LDG1-06]|uniref:Class I SAM-dependent methyltransferase n=1 Tax=Paractinoplanes ovalisporus TaxID=2810368 RepID=A0ABS2AL17_9ACTN|nr:class I SAM-dependent methyltransferase [Actinoplanes ovalisporus]MBM2620547.1 class I SAM-dependent methyltransferase [Actinoplanes ovalisporus]